MSKSPAGKTIMWALTAQLPETQTTSADPFHAVSAAVERGFTASVHQKLHGQVLRYSDRIHLMRAARRLGIERFRANLLIALAQREKGLSGTQSAECTMQNEDEIAIGSGAGISRLHGVLLALIIEAAGLAGLWWAFVR